MILDQIFFCEKRLRVVLANDRKSALNYSQYSCYSRMVNFRSRKYHSLYCALKSACNSQGLMLRRMKISINKGAAIIYDRDGGGRDMGEGVWKRYRL